MKRHATMRASRLIAVAEEPATKRRMHASRSTSSDRRTLEMLHLLTRVSGSARGRLSIHGLRARSVCFRVCDVTAPPWYSGVTLMVWRVCTTPQGCRRAFLLARRRYPSTRNSREWTSHCSLTKPASLPLARRRVQSCQPRWTMAACTSRDGMRSSRTMRCPSRKSRKQSYGSRTDSGSGTNALRDAVRRLARDICAKNFGTRPQPLTVSFGCAAVRARSAVPGGDVAVDGAHRSRPSPPERASRSASGNATRNL